MLSGQSKPASRPFRGMLVSPLLTITSTPYSHCFWLSNRMIQMDSPPLAQASLEGIRNEEVSSGQTGLGPGLLHWPMI